MLQGPEQAHLTPAGSIGHGDWEGLSVRVKVIQAGAAAWLPAQQACAWPAQIVLEVRIPAICSRTPLIRCGVTVEARLGHRGVVGAPLLAYSGVSCRAILSSNKCTDVV